MKHSMLKAKKSLLDAQKRIDERKRPPAMQIIWCARRLFWISCFGFN
jgi:hypothetical protein